MRRGARWSALVVLVVSMGLAPAGLRAQRAPASRRSDDGWGVESLRVRTSFYRQQGRGLQSQAGPREGPGDEEALVIEPIAELVLRQSRRTRHTIVLPVDVVTSASADALDAVARASFVNESGELDVTTTHDATDDTQLRLRYGGRVEEPLRSLHLGGGFTHWLADHNASLGVSLLGIADRATIHGPTGTKEGFRWRATLGAELVLSQVLSRTTLASIVYGLTYQAGPLSTAWNVVPVDRSSRPAREMAPGEHVRHAIGLRLARMIPATRTTLRLGYRYYVDSWGMRAHTGDITAMQHVSARLILALSYRLHWQSAVDFWTSHASADTPAEQLHTSDSDLGRFTAHEAGVRVSYALTEGPWSAAGASRVDMGFLRYWRTNDLRATLFTFGYSRTF